MNVYRISSVDINVEEKETLEEWRKKCVSISDWMDSIEDLVEHLESTEPCEDITSLQQQINNCNVMFSFFKKIVVVLIVDVCYSLCSS